MKEGAAAGRWQHAVTPLAFASLDTYWVPASFAWRLVRLVRRWDVTSDQLLSGLGLTEEAVQDPLGRLSMATFAALIERARALTGEPGLGFYLGLETNVTAYGYLGFAVLSASSLREALEMATRFTAVVSPSVTMRLRAEGRVASLLVEEHVDLGRARDVPLITLVFSMQQIGEALTGRPIPVDYVDLAIPEPAYFPRFKHLMPNARFGRPSTQLVFDAEYLDLPLVQADRNALALAREQCEQTLDALGYQGDADVQRVRQVIGRKDGGFRSFEEVARSLAVSPRTLRRALAMHGLSFSALVEEERRRKAIVLLDAQQLSLKEIANRLGYTALSNFVRAFRRWMGKTPDAYRRARRPVVPRSEPARALAARRFRKRGMTH